MRTALKIGISHGEFWELTPFELTLSVEDYQEKRQEKLENDLTKCWLSAFYRRVKDLNPLQSELSKIKPKKDMTDDEMLSQVKILNSLYEGENNGGN